MLACSVQGLWGGILAGGFVWFDVVVRDLTQEALTLARAEIERLASGALKKGRLNENQVAEIHARLNFATELEAWLPVTWWLKRSLNGWILSKRFYERLNPPAGIRHSNLEYVDDFDYSTGRGAGTG